MWSHQGVCVASRYLSVNAWERKYSGKTSQKEEAAVKICPTLYFPLFYEKRLSLSRIFSCQFFSEKHYSASDLRLLSSWGAPLVRFLDPHKPGRFGGSISCHFIKLYCSLNGLYCTFCEMFRHCSGTTPSFAV